MPVVLKCLHCSHESRMPDAVMVEVLQARGMLKRENSPEFSLVRELLSGVSGDLKCDKCQQRGVAVNDDWVDDWEDTVRCEGCQAAIDPERLEVFPDTKYCPNCQSSSESGGTPGAEREFCERCGGLMKLIKRGGVGLAGYSMVCSDCGKRG